MAFSAPDNVALTFSSRCTLIGKILHLACCEKMAANTERYEMVKEKRDIMLGKNARVLLR